MMLRSQFGTNIGDVYPRLILYTKSTMKSRDAVFSTTIVRSPFCRYTSRNIPSRSFPIAASDFFPERNTRFVPAKTFRALCRTSCMGSHGRKFPPEKIFRNHLGRLGPWRELELSRAWIPRTVPCSSRMHFSLYFNPTRQLLISTKGMICHWFHGAVGVHA